MATLYALGSNGAGQLGIGHQEDVSVPKEVLFKNAPLSSGQVTIRAGGNHTLLLSQQGQLYCAGNFSSGACGLRTTPVDPLSHFQKVQFERAESQQQTETKIAFCAATWEASIVVKRSSDGLASQVCSFGTGNKGELGLGELVFRTAEAQLIKDFPPSGTQIIDLSACVSHVVVVLSNGEVYGWGSGRKGQLGKVDGIVYSPRRIDSIDFEVKRAVCGREFTALFGAAGSGQCRFLGSDKWNIKSSLNSSFQWKDVGAGWGTLFILMQDGKLLAKGRNDHGQLPPSDLPEISQIAVGSEHTVALNCHGEVLVWGWGEHGNCGPKTTRGDVKDRCNVIASSAYLPAGTEIVTVAAGCATSWIFINPV